MAYAPEPVRAHGSTAGVAIVLCNLGTPEAPTPAAVRRYLAEFLSDPRVVEIPRLAWLPILHGIVLRVRPARSARKYASIWMPEGSPLKVWTERQAQLLAGYLGERGVRVDVRVAMRYGSLSIGSALDAAKAAGADRILVLPLYPQYAASTTASIGDALAAWLRRTRNVPAVRLVKHYHDDDGYIGALAARVREHWRLHGRAERLVLSFHGLPRRSLALGDPYHCECLKTGRLLAERLHLADDAFSVTFQSRFGRGEWLQPYTEPTLVAMARAGVRSVDVFCPGFTSDCLETLEEIDQEARVAFVAAGGREFRHVPCLNDQPEWIAALAAIAMRELQGWSTAPASAETSAAERDRAKAAGAPD
ncbi:MAG: ferrochelatase [Caldimonas sp.]